MANQSGGKGNPATTRMGNKNLQARRASSWANGQKRKVARKEAQKAAEARNRALIAAGQPTPWQAARAARKASREPLKAKYEASLKKS